MEFADFSIRPCPACGAQGVTAEAIEGWPIGRCLRCEMRYALRVPRPDELAAIYKAAYSSGAMYQMHRDELTALRSSGRPDIGWYRKRLFLDAVRPAAGDRLLEVGCGIGAFLMAARERGWRAEGIDLSEEAVQLSQDYHKIPVQLGRFEDLPLEAGAYRAIVCWEVLEHVVSPREFLARVKTLLQPDGVFACSVPNEGEKAMHSARRGPASIPPIHLSFWDSRSLANLFALNGFSIRTLRAKRSLLGSIDPSRHPARFLLNQFQALLGRREGGQLFAVVTPDGRKSA